MDPAQRMQTDDEPTVVIAGRDGITQEAMGVDAAPQYALGYEFGR